MTNEEIDAVVLRYVRENPGKRLAKLTAGLAESVPQPRRNVSKALQRLRKAGKARSDGSYWLAVAQTMEALVAMPVNRPSTPWQPTPPTPEQVNASVQAFKACGGPDGGVLWWHRCEDGTLEHVMLGINEEGRVCMPTGYTNDPIAAYPSLRGGLWCPVALPSSTEVPK